MARKKAYLREQVIEQSFAVFIQKGYDSTSMSDLMLATGLNKKSLYNEFGNKEALFFIVLEDFLQKQKAHCRPMLLKEPASLDNIQTFFDDLIERFKESGCLMTLSLNEISCISSEAQTLIEQTLKGLEQAFAHNLASLTHLTEPQISHFSRNLLALMQGYSSLLRSTEMKKNNTESVKTLLNLLKNSR